MTDKANEVAQHIRMLITLIFITRKPCWYKGLYLKLHGNQKFSVHLKITVQKKPKNKVFQIVSYKMKHSECGPCYTEHGLQEHISACQ
jgi:hypothetical protein